MSKLAKVQWECALTFCVVGKRGGGGAMADGGRHHIVIFFPVTHPTHHVPCTRPVLVASKEIILVATLNNILSHIQYTMYLVSRPVISYLSNYYIEYFVLFTSSVIAAAAFSWLVQQLYRCTCISKLFGVDHVGRWH